MIQLYCIFVKQGKVNMYHIVRDRRAVRSADKVIQSLEEILRHTSISNISVSRLCAQCGISRATFYRLFDNLTDVLAYRCDQILDVVSDQLCQRPDMSPKEISVFILESWMNHAVLMEALVEGHYMEILYHSQISHLDMFRSLFRQAEDMDEKTLFFQIQHLCFLLPAQLMVWQRNGKKETAEEIYEQITKSIRILSKIL